MTRARGRISIQRITRSDVRWMINDKMADRDDSDTLFIIILLRVPWQVPLDFLGLDWGMHRGMVVASGPSGLCIADTMPYWRSAEAMPGAQRC
jgi:hypothetical protein